jgi:hypothetical protein
MVRLRDIGRLQGKTVFPGEATDARDTDEDGLTGFPPIIILQRVFCLKSAILPAESLVSMRVKLFDSFSYLGLLPVLEASSTVC